MKIDAKLKENGLALSAKELIQFISEAIIGREHSKFIFTRTLSRTLGLIVQLGQVYNISREDLAHLDIRSVLEMYTSLDHRDVRSLLVEDIERNRERFEVTKLIRLPQLIRSDADIVQFYLSAVEPNFITQGKVTNLIVLEEELSKADLNGKIIFIRGADPGYDWLFSRQIGGLVTMYGGANSHMAIRCAELNIPAVIGCGEGNYWTWSKSRLFEIDALSKIARNIQ